MASNGEYYGKLLDLDNNDIRFVLLKNIYEESLRLLFVIAQNMK